jgi:hypothetical protein
MEYTGPGYTEDVVGTRQADGSVNASMIAIGGAGGFGPGGAPGASPSS